MTSKKKGALAPLTAADLTERKEEAMGELLALIGRADGGDKTALAQLQTIYAGLPEIAQKLTGLQATAERNLFAHYSPGARETLITQLQNERKRLAGDDPSPLERILANRIALDWAASLEADRRCVLAPGESRTLALSDFYEKQAERAHRRLMRSTKTLAEVRKLLRPSVQVNIAEKQVNVAGDVHTAKESLA